MVTLALQLLFLSWTKAYQSVNQQEKYFRPSGEFKNKSFAKMNQRNVTENSKFLAQKELILPLTSTTLYFKISLK